MDTFEANEHLGFADDERDYSDAVRMLEVLGLPGSVFCRRTRRRRWH